VLEDENIEFSNKKNSRYLKWHKRFPKISFVFTKIKTSRQDLSNKLTSVQFGQNLMKIDEIHSEKNMMIFRMLNISNKKK
jgi:hypothetical protein